MLRTRTLLAGALGALLAGGAVAYDGTVQFPGDYAAVQIAMSAELASCHENATADGVLRSVESWSETGADEKYFVIEAEIMVPAKVPGFYTYKDALAADVRVRLSREPDGVFAECMLAAQSVPRFGPMTYRVELVGSADLVKPLQGVCDVDIYQRGIQVGIPELATKDYVEVSSLVEHQLFNEYVPFLDGYCE